MRTILASTVREPMSGGQLNQLRRDGFIPATISTRGEATQNCTVNRQKLAYILRQYGDSALIEVEGTAAGGSVLVISRDIQRDAISGNLLHVGFQRLSTREPITAEVRLTLIGEPEEVRTKVGTLEQVASTVQVRALPDKLPANIEVDTSAMLIGGAMHLADLPVNPNYEIVTAGDTVIAVVHLLRGAPADEEAAEAAPAAEPAAE
jgi:large subunit ribosomal protein L25